MSSLQCSCTDVQRYQCANVTLWRWKDHSWAVPVLYSDTWGEKRGHARIGNSPLFRRKRRIISTEICVVGADRWTPKGTPARESGDTEYV